MYRTAILIALSAIGLACAAHAALAGPARHPDTVTLLDAAICSSTAPPDARCDLRLGTPPGVHRMFGMTVCLGGAPTGVRCDVTLPRAATLPGTSTRAVAASGPRVVPLFGAKLCFGDVPAGTRCDLRLGGRQLHDTRATAPAHKASRGG